MKTVKIFKDTSRTDSVHWLVECANGELAPMEAFGTTETHLRIVYAQAIGNTYSTGPYADLKGELLYVIDVYGRILVDTGPLVAVFANRTEDDRVLVVQADGTYAPMFDHAVTGLGESVYKIATDCRYITCTAQEAKDTIGGLLGYIDNKGVYNEV